ncbi:MAG: hypothetical protein A3A44_00570 [Candidatus Sungbacteria bacterium RIFCSPLOWO2_01_FULL_60_25]|uniref:Polysaccharide biosynthesis protein C-terminal domain-containing protein n=1 Tax=Candidatus Sungbacteria bacterium RIFCSPLOWO2_01_FULL_60_25 TaxID=1802281 RepID=A0A1G2LBR4_9BACT|nr:MAG: hypothetical protein A3A44_00570 [Candidatus Sungbacteria bacterium RIFCSPLOWO2_01_FULL_60_25]
MEHLRGKGKAFRPETFQKPSARARGWGGISPTEDMVPTIAHHEKPTFSQLLIWGTVRGYFWSGIGQALSAANSFVVIAALSVYEFGLYQLVLSVIAITDSLLSGLFDDVLSNEVARSFAEGRRDHAKRLFLEYASFKIALGIAAFLALFAGAQLIAVHYDKDIATLIRIASMFFIVNAISEVVSIFFRTTISYRAMGAGAVQEFVRLALLLTFWARHALTLKELFIISIVTAGVSFLYVGWSFSREYRLAFGHVPMKRAWLMVGVVRQYGGWILMRYGISKVFKQIDPILVRIFLSTEAVGITSAATTGFTYMQQVFPLRSVTTLLPRIIGDEARFGSAYRRGIKYLFWIGCAAVIASAVAVPVGIIVLLPKYQSAIPLFLLILVNIPLYGIYKFQKSSLIVLREQKILTMRLLTEGVATAAILAALLPIIGIYALAMDIFLSYSWRVYFNTSMLARRYPHLRLFPRKLFSYEAEDKEFFIQAFRELFRPRAWFRPVRAGDA